MIFPPKRPVERVGQPLCRLRRARLLYLLLTVALLLIPGRAAAPTPVLEVRNLGLSRVGERTVLTILVNQAVTPRVTPVTGVREPQLVVEFPQARAGKLPSRLAGDEVLVKQVRVEAGAGGVRLILDLVPEQPYLFSREVVPLRQGTAMVRVALRSDPEAAPVREGRALGPVTSTSPWKTEAARPAAPSTPGLSESSPGRSAPAPAFPVAPTGTFEELQQLIPQGRGLLEYLRREGWLVAAAQSHDQPGQRYSRSFTLTNSRYPELTVRIAHLPPNAPGAPTINLIDLSMENLEGEAAAKYRELRKWDFGRIRRQFEDIGDFFDEALKPLRVEIRKQCQDLAGRYSQTIAHFLHQAAPHHPRLPDQALEDIRKKVSPRFEGVQYTLSEDPLIILNLVDFLYLRVYYVGS